MEPTHPHLILGYHGCDHDVAERVFAGRDHLMESENPYDWLGHGTYFWENSPARALQYAQHLRDKPRRGRPRIQSPAVVGAIIDLGTCLNLLDESSIALVAAAYHGLQRETAANGVPLPQNASGGSPDDLLVRYLDCAVIEYLHSSLGSDHSFDSVRSAFVEGPRLYPQAGFHQRTHIQICVRTPERILGYFRPRTRA